MSNICHTHLLHTFRFWGNDRQMRKRKLIYKPHAASGHTAENSYPYIRSSQNRIQYCCVGMDHLNMDGASSTSNETSPTSLYLSLINNYANLWRTSIVMRTKADILWINCIRLYLCNSTFVVGLISVVEIQWSSFCAVHFTNQIIHKWISVKDRYISKFSMREKSITIAAHFAFRQAEGRNNVFNIKDVQNM
jgi:hypothetical protein